MLNNACPGASRNLAGSPKGARPEDHGLQRFSWFLLHPKKDGTSTMCSNHKSNIDWTALKCIHHAWCRTLAYAVNHTSCVSARCTCSSARENKESSEGTWSQHELGGPRVWYKIKSVPVPVNNWKMVYTLTTDHAIESHVIMEVNMLTRICIIIAPAWRKECQNA